MVEKEYIERRVNINGKNVLAKYYPASGKFEFGEDSLLGMDVSLTQAGAFRTMRELTDSFRGVDVPKISYFAQDPSLHHALVKDKLYARTLNRLGYEEKKTKLSVSWLDRIIERFLKKLGIKVQETPPGFRYKSLSGEWIGPERVWVKKGLETSVSTIASPVASILGILGGIFFLVNGLSNYNLQFSPGEAQFNWKLWIGIVLLVLGILFGVYSRKEK